MAVERQQYEETVETTVAQILNNEKRTRNGKDKEPWNGLAKLWLMD
jgi:hypothetical protein